MAVVQSGSGDGSDTPVASRRSSAPCPRWAKGRHLGPPIAGHSPTDLWYTGGQGREKLMHRRLLGNLSSIHDRDALGEAGNDSQVVRDQDDRHAGLAA